MRRVLGVALAMGALLLLPQPARADSATVEVRDDYYQPNVVTIFIGENVTWTVVGDHPHSVTSDDLFDSSPNCNSLTDPAQQRCMHQGDEFTATFNTAGRYQYHCRVHGDAMSGTVIVESTTSTESTTTTASTSTTTTISSSSSSSSTGSDQSTLSQAPAPTFTSTTRVALPRKPTVATGRAKDDYAPWVIVDVVLAGTTTLVGVALVRKGRVPLG